MCFKCLIVATDQGQITQLAFLPETLQAWGQITTTLQRHFRHLIDSITSLISLITCVLSKISAQSTLVEVSVTDMSSDISSNACKVLLTSRPR